MTKTIAVDDGLWERVEAFIPANPRRFRSPGRKRLDDRRAMDGILFVLHTGIAWRHLPKELGYGSGVTCWRRLREWREAGCGSVFTKASWPSSRARGRSIGPGC